MQWLLFARSILQNSLDIVITAEQIGDGHGDPKYSERDKWVRLRIR